MQLGKLVTGVELLHRHQLRHAVRRHVEVEIERKRDGRFQYLDQRFPVYLPRSEPVATLGTFPFALHEILHLMVDENTPYQVAFVLSPIVLERVGQEIIDVYHPAVGIVGTLRQIGILPYLMSVVKPEHVGLHGEYEDVFGDLYLGLELAPVTVFDTYAFVYLFVQLLVQLGRELQQRLFQLVEHDKRVV